LAKSTNYEAPHYAAFSTLPSLSVTEALNEKCGISVCTTKFSTWYGLFDIVRIVKTNTSLRALHAAAKNTDSKAIS
jgi:hypothetical protein